MKTKKKHLVSILSVLLAAIFALTACITDTKGESGSPSVSTPVEVDVTKGESGSSFVSIPVEVDVQVGDYITFGHYEQDGDTSNGEEAIEWLVLDKQGDEIFVVSKYILDCQSYDAERDGVTWGTCSLRVWLNRDFYNNAFSSEEKAKIPTATVTPDTIPGCYDIDPGSATYDRMFLLNIYEANVYFYSDDDRKCEPTEYVKSKDAYTYEGSCQWWIRSPGYRQYYAVYVEGNGSVYEDGCDVSRDFIGVRPAMWIDLGA